jgi:type I restriction enzyme S subunit
MKDSPKGAKPRRKTEAEVESSRTGSCALIPKLRFPEFRDEPGWDAMPGDELFDQINNRQASAGLPILAITQEFGAIPRNDIDYHVSVTDKSVETYKEVLPGDFIISLRSFQGGIEYSECHGICSPAYVILRKKTNLSDLFFKHFFKSHRFIQQLTKNLEGLRDGKMISYKQFSELLLHTPTPAEQLKIANCLTSLDELIAAESYKLDALKTHKKGLMQQLFPREGETRPRLRFPEFRKAPEWKSKRLSSMIDLISGMHLSPEQYGTTGEVPYFTGPSDFTNDVQGVRKWTKRSANIAQTEDTLITVKGSGVGEIWYSTLPAVAMGRQLMAVRTKHGSSLFMFQFLLTKRTRFEDLGSGNLIPGLSRSDILELEAHFPTPSEQQRIASCLSTLDDLIAAQSDKIDTLKTHKKGLMQQLFPSLSKAN